MKRLEDIPKKNVFQVPDGYFDRLPGVIQARVATQDPSPLVIFSWSRSLKYALPVIALVAIGIFWYRPSSTPTPIHSIESELGIIQPGQLAVYLEDHELTTEDLVETTSWSPEDLNELQNSVYSTLDVAPHDELETILDEYNEL